MEDASDLELEWLFKGLAKRCHPDAAATAQDRARRHALMQRVNGAKARRDVRDLRQIARELEGRPPAPPQAKPAPPPAPPPAADADAADAAVEAEVRLLSRQVLRLLEFEVETRRSSRGAARRPTGGPLDALFGYLTADEQTLALEIWDRRAHAAEPGAFVPSVADPDLPEQLARRRDRLADLKWTVLRLTGRMR